MILKTYDDGSELTAGKLAIAISIGTIAGIGGAYIAEKIGNERHKRWMTKNGYPQEVIDRY